MKDEQPPQQPTRLRRITPYIRPALFLLFLVYAFGAWGIMGYFLFLAVVVLRRAWHMRRMIHLQLSMLETMLLGGARTRFRWRWMERIYKWVEGKLE